MFTPASEAGQLACARDAAAGLRIIRTPVRASRGARSRNAGSASLAASAWTGCSLPASGTCGWCLASTSITTAPTCCTVRCSSTYPQDAHIRPATWWLCTSCAATGSRPDPRIFPGRMNVTQVPAPTRLALLMGSFWPTETTTTACQTANISHAPTRPAVFAPAHILRGPSRMSRHQPCRPIPKHAAARQWQRPLIVASLAPVRHDHLQLVHSSRRRTAFTTASGLLEEGQGVWLTPWPMQSW